MRRDLLPILLGLVLATGTPRLANNNLFLPGDAFFPTELTKSKVAALRAAKTGDREFAYSKPAGNEGAFCGYAATRMRSFLMRMTSSRNMLK